MAISLADMDCLKSTVYGACLRVENHLFKKDLDEACAIVLDTSMSLQETRKSEIPLLKIRRLSSLIIDMRALSTSATRMIYAERNEPGRKECLIELREQHSELKKLIRYAEYYLN